MNGTPVKTPKNSRNILFDRRRFILLITLFNIQK